MLFTICIALILIASVLIILAILVQSPKSGMAANFGASNQVMGVRETTDFLEKFTWTMAIGIALLCVVSTLSLSSSNEGAESTLKADHEMIENRATVEAPAMPQDAQAAPAAAEEVPAN